MLKPKSIRLKPAHVGIYEKVYGKKKSAKAIRDILRADIVINLKIIETDDYLTVKYKGEVIESVNVDIESRNSEYVRLYNKYM